MSKLFWYQFPQNNSGGGFVIDHGRGLSRDVFIQAHTKEEAIIRALSIGIYFNGVEDGIDCNCCGDRWSESNIISLVYPAEYSSMNQFIGSFGYELLHIIHHVRCYTLGAHPIAAQDYFHWYDGTISNYIL